MTVLPSNDSTIPVVRHAKLKRLIKSFDAGRVNSVVLIVLALLVGSQGLVFSSMNANRLQFAVTESDLVILETAHSLITHKSNWVHGSSASCTSMKAISLYCLLEQAAKIVDGKMALSEGALMEVQKAIESHFGTVGTGNPIVDFNSREAVEFEDIKLVLAAAVLSMKENLKRSELTLR